MLLYTHILFNTARRNNLYIEKNLFLDFRYCIKRSSSLVSRKQGKTSSLTTSLESMSLSHKLQIPLTVNKWRLRFPEDVERCTVMLDVVLINADGSYTDVTIR